MRPEVIAEVTKAVQFPSANLPTRDLLPDAVRNDPIVYPGPAAMARLHMNAALSEEYTRRQNREFDSFCDKFRDECRSLEWCRNWADAKIVAESRRRRYQACKSHPWAPISTLS